jgi:hypothetical protein
MRPILRENQLDVLFKVWQGRLRLAQVIEQ